MILESLKPAFCLSFILVINSVGAQTFLSGDHCRANFPELSISATENVICIGDCIGFSDQSADESLSNWQWTFEGGDPAIGMIQNPEAVCYLAFGSYDVTLQVDYQGQTYDSTFSDFITVIDTCGPVANFEFAPIVCLGYCYDFENTSTGAESYFWTFQGATPSTSEQENPEDICYLDQTGVFNVTLTAINEFGATSSITQKVTAVNQDNIDAGPDQTISQGTTTTLSAFGGESGQYLWLPTDYVTCFDCPSTQTVPLQTSTIFTLFYEEPGGCQNSDTVTVFVDETSGINKLLDSQITLYPNPAKDFVTIELPEGQWQLNLMDAAGKSLHSVGNITDSRFDLELKGLAPGAYFVQVSSDEGFVVKKLVVE